MNRRLAELLVDGGFVSRREAETALREARQGQHALMQVLVRSGRLHKQAIDAASHLEGLLAQNHAGLRLSEFLLDADALSRKEMKRALLITRRTGQPLGAVLIKEGYLGRRRRRPRNMVMARRFATAAIGAAVVMGTMGMAGKPGAGKQTIVQSGPAKLPTAAPPPGVDLRYASLGDISKQLKRLRRPAFNHHVSDKPKQTPPRSRKYRTMVELYAGQYHLPPELIYAMIEKESEFNPHARSEANAVGLMQLIPHEGGRAAYSYVQRRLATPSIEELMDPKTNIQLGAAYLRLLLDSYFSEISDEKIRTAILLAAYNWGPGNVLEALDGYGMPKTLEEVDSMLRNRAPKETRNYVRTITRMMEIYS